MAKHDAFRGPDRISPAKAHWRARGATLARLRRVAAIVSTCILVILAFEGALRVFEAWQEGRLGGFDPLAALKWSPGSQWQGRTINARGYWDDEFESRPRAGKFRVAALGHALALSGCGDTNCLARVQQRVPRLDVFNFGLPQAGPREFAHQAAAEVIEHRPDLVLLFIAVGDDHSASTVRTRSMAWHNVRLVSYASQAFDRKRAVHTTTEQQLADPYERRLHRGRHQLDICRVPEDGNRKEQWRAVSEHLDRIVAKCAEREIELALVLVPADFQLSPSLRDTLVRRGGSKSSDYDFELPQRRWARFAHERKVAMLDLLPLLRATKGSVYQPDAADFSQHGLELASTALGDWLQARYEPAINATAQAAFSPGGAE